MRSCNSSIIIAIATLTTPVLGASDVTSRRFQVKEAEYIAPSPRTYKYGDIGAETSQWKDKLGWIRFRDNCLIFSAPENGAAVSINWDHAREFSCDAVDGGYNFAIEAKRPDIQNCKKLLRSSLTFKILGCSAFFVAKSLLDALVTKKPVDKWTKFDANCIRTRVDTFSKMEIPEFIAVEASGINVTSEGNPEQFSPTLALVKIDLGDFPNSAPKMIVVDRSCGFHKAPMTIDLGNLLIPTEIYHEKHYVTFTVRKHMIFRGHKVKFISFKILKTKDAAATKLEKMLEVFTSTIKYKDLEASSEMLSRIQSFDRKVATIKEDIALSEPERIAKEELAMVEEGARRIQQAKKEKDADDRRRKQKKIRADRDKRLAKEIEAHAVRTKKLQNKVD